jgi:aspartate carbamoyltransferase catalytic subunit
MKAARNIGLATCLITALKTIRSACKIMKTAPIQKLEKHSHCLDIENLGFERARKILKRAHVFSLQDSGRGLDHKTAKALNGKVILNLFFENSTRTRLSFDMAALRLGGQTMTMAVAQSSLNKGESMNDTLATLGALNPDAVIIRSGDYNAPRFAAQILDCPVINAGDSWRAHPTQALLDALTVAQTKGRTDDFDFSGLTVAICGDIAHSRVARSNATLLQGLGAEIRIVAPDYFMPKPNDFEGCSRYETLDDGIKDVDFVMMLRVQKERFEEHGSLYSEEDFSAGFGLSEERLEAFAPKAFVMHPGPVNRDIEIEDSLTDDPQRSLILKQVENGVPTRMAVLENCLLENTNA